MIVIAGVGTYYYYQKIFKHKLNELRKKEEQYELAKSTEAILFKDVKVRLLLKSKLKNFIEKDFRKLVDKYPVILLTPPEFISKSDEKYYIAHRYRIKMRAKYHDFGKLLSELLKKYEFAEIEKLRMRYSNSKNYPVDIEFVLICYTTKS